MRAPYLHHRFPALRDTLAHVPLGAGPTPLTPLGAWASNGGAEVWLKDEGAFGDGDWGGNKVRKLEWLIPEAQRRGPRTILSFGGLGTNWGYALTRYAAAHGIDTALALVDQPVDDHVRAQLVRLRGSGATLHHTRTKARTAACVPWLLVRHVSRGRLPYVLPAGGSSAVGAIGYVETALELAAQVDAGTMPEPSHLVTAVGSGGTAAGLLLGLRIAGLRTRVVAVVVNDTLRLDAVALVRLARRAERLLRQRGADLPDQRLTVDDLDVTTDWLGPGYGHATPEAEAARALAAAHEGPPLDPVYAGKATAALLAMNAARRFGDGPVVLLQTNGPR
ncbi:MAG: pyridoxal-phosphate dependent enzyme [Patulibacter sp.]|nr:pyridoxal-phosphate dependent enzyme [Patulibacter sp.]